jgi:hypothetical protein
MAVIFENVAVCLPPGTPAGNLSYAFKGGALVLSCVGFTGDVTLRLGA